MDPVTLIVTALVAGAAKAAGKTAEQIVSDAYNGLKNLIKSKFGHDSTLASAVNVLEAKPDSADLQGLVKNQLEASKAAEDPEIKSAAQQLYDLVKAQPGGAELVNQIATGNYIAQASGGSTATVTISGQQAPTPSQPK
jgi:hypothetical protein